MDTITYDFSRLNLDELVELRDLQRRMLDLGGSVEAFDTLSVEELRALERLYYKMEGKPDPYPEPAPTTYCHWCGHVVGAVAYTNSCVPGVCCSEQCLENSQLTRHRRTRQAAMESQPVASNPPAVAPAPAPAPAATAETAEADKPNSPDVMSSMSAARQLDALMRFGA